SGCVDAASELRKRGRMSAEELAALPDGNYTTTAWTLSPQPVAHAVKDDPYGYGVLKAQCAALLVVPERTNGLSLRQWTGDALETLAQPDPKEGGISAWAISPGCKYWITGSALGVVRAWRTDRKAESTLVRAPAGIAHASGITAL